MGQWRRQLLILAIYRKTFAKNLPNDSCHRKNIGPTLKGFIAR